MLQTINNVEACHAPSIYVRYVYLGINKNSDESDNALMQHFRATEIGRQIPTRVWHMHRLGHAFLGTMILISRCENNTSDTFCRKYAMLNRTITSKSSKAIFSDNRETILVSEFSRAGEMRHKSARVTEKRRIYLRYLLLRYLCRYNLSFDFLFFITRRVWWRKREKRRGKRTRNKSSFFILSVLSRYANVHV